MAETGPQPEIASSPEAAHSGAKLGDGHRGLEEETVPGPGTPSLALAFWEDTLENSVQALTAQTKQKSKWRRRREPARKDMLKA